MRIAESKVELSASDLSHFVGCRHRAVLDLAVAQGQIEGPDWVDPMLKVLEERGRAQERQYVDSLASKGLVVLDLSEHEGSGAEKETTEAMRAGIDVIVHAVLHRGSWYGRPDLLRRVENPSRLGVWSYEAIDTRLAFTTRGGTLLQILLYCDLLGEVQELRPERFHVITQDERNPIHSFRLVDYGAYFRLLRVQLETLTILPASRRHETDYPVPTEHCEGCSWGQRCDSRRRQDDHLSLVAGISRLQRRELEAAGIRTLAELGRLPVDFPFRPRRGSVESLVRAREQARVQLAARETGSLIHELLSVVANRGLMRLPEPQVGDVFLAIEGNPFVPGGGREYLFGLAIVQAGGALRTLSLWATTAAQECAAFERVVAEIERLWAIHRDMHVYHYSQYEPLGLKNLMGRYARCEASIDRLLHASRFVDLYSIVQQAVRASVERYSLRNLEPFYQFEREVPLVVARQGIRVVERAIEFGTQRELDADARVAVESYNRDICLSTRALRDWLELLRAGAVTGGQPIPRPTFQEDATSEEVSPRQQRADALVDALTAGIPFEPEARTENQQARWLLAQLVGWHRREQKGFWWEFFRLSDLADYDLLEERTALSGLTLIARIGGTARHPIDRYSFPDQECDVCKGDTLCLPGTGQRLGIVEAIDRMARTVDIEKTSARADLHPRALIIVNLVVTHMLQEPLLQLAEDTAAQGLENATRYRAARELLLARAPRLLGGKPFVQATTESAVDFATRVVTQLDHGVLAIQGPPGSGKTFTGANMICELVKQGARVGVTATSHNVIANLLDMVLKIADRSGVSVKCVRKVSTLSESPGRIVGYVTNVEIEDTLESPTPPVVGGSPYLWVREQLYDKLDVLFVDEAAQMSLANVLAVSQCARSIVLLGDPRQLEQPQMGLHPPGADRSGLDHMLKDDLTFKHDRGIFLAETWRLPPAICSFTSEVFYEEKLRSCAGLEKCELRRAGPIAGAGLWILPVAHEGNQDSSLEEADAIERLLDQVLIDGAEWVGRDAGTQPLGAEHVLVVAPYNAHIALLTARLASRGIRVGTVDKFQGQEAPIVIYSMATSAAEDAPRGMEFLYSLNRLNVAISRAQCVCVVVASPRLFTPECRTPRQMQMANVLCRYVEMAKTLSLTDLGGKRRAT